MKLFLVIGLISLQICSECPLCAQDSAAILKPDALRNFVATFNGQRPDDTAVDLPSDGSITAIRNGLAAKMPEKAKELADLWQKQTDEYVALAKLTVAGQPKTKVAKKAAAKKAK